MITRWSSIDHHNCVYLPYIYSFKFHVHFNCTAVTKASYCLHCMHFDTEHFAEFDRNALINETLQMMMQIKQWYFSVVHMMSMWHENCVLQTRYYVRNLKSNFLIFQMIHKIYTPNIIQKMYELQKAYFRFTFVNFVASSVVKSTENITWSSFCIAYWARTLAKNLSRN